MVQMSGSWLPTVQDSLLVPPSKFGCSGQPTGTTFKVQATNLLRKDLRRFSIAKIHTHDNVLNIAMVLLLYTCIIIRLLCQFFLLMNKMNKVANLRMQHQIFLDQTILEPDQCLLIYTISAFQWQFQPHKNYSHINGSAVCNSVCLTL